MAKAKVKTENYGVPASALGPKAPAPKASSGGGASPRGGRDDLPFATAGGKPKQATPGKPTNPLEPPYTGGEEGKGPVPRDFIGESRRQGDPPSRSSAPTDPVARANRAQTPVPVTQRVNAQSIPPDGVTHGLPLQAPAWRAGTGSVDNSGAPVGKMPFKNMK